jgi:hypothetical protein
LYLLSNYIGGVGVDFINLLYGYESLPEFILNTGTSVGVAAAATGPGILLGAYYTTIEMTIGWDGLICNSAIKIRNIY